MSLVHLLNGFDRLHGIRLAPGEKGLAVVEHLSASPEVGASDFSMPMIRQSPEGKRR